MSTKQSKPQTYRGIKDIGPALPPVDASMVAAGLGAEATDLELGPGGSPLSLTQVRQELMRRLHSSGGRPSLSGASGRKKIPVSDRQWEELEEIASAVALPDFSPSAGQIASVMLTFALRAFWKSKDSNAEEAE